MGTVTTMTSKERVLTALSRREPDRVPINYAANPGIDRRLKEHFGLAAEDSRGLRERLGVDFVSLLPDYTGPKLYDDEPERGVQIDNWGIHRRWVEHESGGYWDFCDFPLKDATVDDIAAWRMPDPDDYDYSTIAERCRRWGERAVVVGGAGIGDIINSSGMLRTMEQVLVDLITDDAAGRLLARRRTDTWYEIIRRTIEAADGGIDILWMGEDLGTQIAPLISRDVYRRAIRPFHQQFVDLGKAHGLKIVIHTCGSSSWAYEDFIEMGVDAVDTLQPEAKAMAPAYLKATFGDRLAFHGCISTAGPVAKGSVEEVVADCRQTLDIMMPGGGYCFAPTHQLQDNSPTENVLAMYETAHTHGRYR